MKRCTFALAASAMMLAVPPTFTSARVASSRSSTMPTMCSTTSQPVAAARRDAGRATSPSCGVTPAGHCLASFRAWRETRMTSWPRARSSVTVPVPTTPVPPVTRVFMRPQKADRVPPHPPFVT